MRNTALISLLLLGISPIAWAQETLTGFKAPALIDEIERNGRPVKKTAAIRVRASSETEIDPNLSRYILQGANKYQLDPLLVIELIRQESSFRTGAVSPAGALGIAQLMPETARRLEVDPFDPIAAIEAGCKYLHRLLQRYGRRTELALAAYNAGENAVDAYLLGESMCCTSKGGLINPKKIKSGGIPPYRETQEYVDRITKAYSSVKATLRAQGWDPEKIGIEQIDFLIPNKPATESSLTAARRLPRETKDSPEGINTVSDMGWQTSQDIWIEASAKKAEPSNTAERPNGRQADIWKTGDLRKSPHPTKEEKQ